VRRLYVTVRLAAAVVAVAAAAGCMSVGEDGAGPGAGPSHSTEKRHGEAPDGGATVSGGGGYVQAAHGATSDGSWGC